MRAREPKRWANDLCEELKLDPLFHNEVRFWAIELALKGGFSQHILERLDATRKTDIFPSQIEPLLNAGSGEKPKVLDVGSGPVSMLAWGGLTGLFDLTAVDPLAEPYKRILQNYGHKIPHALENVPGEKLVEKFGEAAFDLTWMCNALDHSQDPLLVFRNLVRVTKPGGYIVVSLYACEGTTENFDGLHQHDIFSESGGRLVMRSWDASEKRLSGPVVLSDGLPITVHKSTPPTTKPAEWVEIIWRRASALQ